MSFPSQRYRDRVAKALDEAFEQARVEEFDIRSDRLIVFSDHHRGVRDGADDFRDSEKRYHAALGYYFEKGYILAVLGDVEELWENDRKPVLTSYGATLKLEKTFHEARRDGAESNEHRRYWRIWGNHDDDWRFKKLVETHLAPLIPGITVHESLKLIVKDKDGEIGKILFVHGHQGTLDSDRFGRFSRIFVRRIWRPIQRRTQINPNTPAKDWELRKTQNIALYNWAVKKKNLVLMAGHTHHPVFFDEGRIKKLEEKLDEAENKGDEESIPLLRADLEYALVREARRGFTMDQPCYFNSGCCCFADGDITGLEIESGELRLVRWLDNEGRRQPEVLTSMKLDEVFDRVGVVGEALKP